MEQRLAHVAVRDESVVGVKRNRTKTLRRRLAFSPPELEDVRSDFSPRRSSRTSMPSKRVPLILDSSSRACSGVRAAENDCSVTMLA